MSDRVTLEDALLSIEAKARIVLDAAHDDESEVSVRTAFALIGLKESLAKLDAARDEIRART